MRNKLKVIINPDKETVTKIVKALQENDFYCPCALVKSPDTKCQCKAFRTQKEAGQCHCGLYIKIEDK